MSAFEKTLSSLLRRRGNGKANDVRRSTQASCEAETGTVIYELCDVSDPAI